MHPSRPSSRLILLRLLDVLILAPTPRTCQSMASSKVPTTKIISPLKSMPKVPSAAATPRLEPRSHRSPRTVVEHVTLEAAECQTAPHNATNMEKDDPTLLLLLHLVPPSERRPDARRRPQPGRPRPSCAPPSIPHFPIVPHARHVRLCATLHGPSSGMTADWSQFAPARAPALGDRLEPLLEVAREGSAC